MGQEISIEAAVADACACPLSGELDPESPEFTRMGRIARQHLRMLRRSIRLPHHHKLLDIGCANGLFLDEARRAGFEAYGAELSPDTAAFARTYFGLEVHPGDWREADYADGSFDVVTLFDTIEHLPDPLGELAALRGLLKPGGLLLQSAPNTEGLLSRRSHTLAALTSRAGYRVTRLDRTRTGRWLGRGDWLYLAARRPA